MLFHLIETAFLFEIIPAILSFIYAFHKIAYEIA